MTSLGQLATVFGQVAMFGAMAALLFGCEGSKQGVHGLPPATERGEVVDTLHGVEIPDPYRWL